MERRPYFIAGDLAVVLTIGVLSSLGARSLVPSGCSMWAGMATGMFVGMGLMLTVGTVFQVFFGAMEVMILGASSGMITGMIVGMLACAGPITTKNATLLGVGCALLCMAFVYGMNAYLTREGHSWTT